MLSRYVCRTITKSMSIEWKRGKKPFYYAEYETTHKAFGSSFSFSHEQKQNFKQ